MIEKIVLKSTDPFIKDKKTLEFGKTNILIGYKGGGKSTLYDLLANLSGGSILSTTYDALASHNLELDSYTSNGETYPANTLRTIKFGKGKEKEKEIRAHYSAMNNVIYQSDPIKTALTDDKDIFNDKMEFSRNLITESGEVNEYVNKVKKLYTAIHQVAGKHKQVINWSNALDIKGQDHSAEQVIFDLNYSSFSIQQDYRSSINIIKENKTDLSAKISVFNSRVSELKSNTSKLISEKFITESIQFFESEIESHKKFLLLVEAEEKLINKKAKAISSFDKAYKKVVAELKRSKQSENIVSSYISQSKGHFKEMAKLLKEAKQAFANIISTDITLHLKEKKETSSMLELALEEDIKLTHELKFTTLKKVLHNAKNTESLVENWIKASINNSKEFKAESIITEVAKVATEEVKVLANGKNYDDLSLGQRSIYGIKYKFNKTSNQAIFLDQPEDNLDNYTISSELVGMINDKHEQKFIVTHNGNIGLLSNPDRVILCEFEHEDKLMDLSQYKIGTIKIDEKGSDAAHYLEGGIESIKKRIKIIEGEI